MELVEEVRMGGGYTLFAKSREGIAKCADSMPGE